MSSERAASEGKAAAAAAASGGDGNNTMSGVGAAASVAAASLLVGKSEKLDEAQALARSCAGRPDFQPCDGLSLCATHSHGRCFRLHWCCHLGWCHCEYRGRGGLGWARRMGRRKANQEKEEEEGFGGSLQAAAFQMFRAVAGNPLAEGCRSVGEAGGRAEMCGAFGKGSDGLITPGNREESVA